MQKIKSIDKVGYFVANKTHYNSFLIKNPNFEEENLVIKEWDIYEQAHDHKPDLKRINNYQSEFGEIDLWSPYVTDRRLSFGKKYAFKQSYDPHFTFKHILSILDISFNDVCLDIIDRAVKKSNLISRKKD